MKVHSLSVALLIALACSGAVAQQMYKWVGKDGKVNYTDSPPPAFAKQSAMKATAGGGPDTSNLPFELAQATKNNPVTLYTGTDCVPCDSGRALLSARGIPFSEKTVKTVEDGQRLKQVGGAGTLPLLIVGRSQQSGFEASGWGTALTAAGYPETSKLPASYRNPAVESAAPKVVKDAGTAKKNPDPAPLAVPDNAQSSGFRF
jgi:glutaredoxin